MLFVQIAIKGIRTYDLLLSMNRNKKKERIDQSDAIKLV